MKFDLLALATLAALASAAPNAAEEHQLEARDVVKVDKVTFFGWDGKPQDVVDNALFYNDPEVIAKAGDVVAKVGAAVTKNDKDKRTFGLLWAKWWWWRGMRCNWCWSCSPHGYYGGCMQGRCCA